MTRRRSDSGLPRSGSSSPTPSAPQPRRPPPRFGLPRILNRAGHVLASASSSRGPVGDLDQGLPNLGTNFGPKNRQTHANYSPILGLAHPGGRRPTDGPSHSLGTKRVSSRSRVPLALERNKTLRPVRDPPSS